MRMRRIAIGAALTGVGVLVARALAPKLHARLMAGCERMFEQMPDNLPPKRMMRGIEEICANSARTLALLEAREQAGEAEKLREASPTKRRATRLARKRKRSSPRSARASPSTTYWTRREGSRERRTDHSAR
jgi:hypothetical protein